MTAHFGLSWWKYKCGENNVQLSSSSECTAEIGDISLSLSLETETIYTRAGCLSGVWSLVMEEKYFLCSWSCPSLVCVEERLWCLEMVPGGPQTRLETAGLQSVPRPPQLRVRPCDQTDRQADSQTSDISGPAVLHWYRGGYCLTDTEWSNQIKHRA